MSFTGQRIAEALSGGINNIGGALLSEIARRRRQEVENRELALKEELGRGNLDLGRDRLAFDREDSTADRSLDAAIAGYAPAPAVERQESSLPPLPVPDPVSVPGRGDRGPSAGDALMGLLSGKGRSEPPRFVYNPENHGAAIMAEQEREFRGSENQADRSLRASEGAASRQTQLDVAELYQNRGTDRQQTESMENRARAAAVALSQEAGGVQEALQQIASDPDTPAKAAIMTALQELMYEQGRRNLLGIGGADNMDALIQEAIGGGF